MMILKVCSDRPKAHRNTGDTFHLAVNGKTFCGRDASYWLRMGEADDQDFNSAYLCKRCHAKAFAA